MANVGKYILHGSYGIVMMDFLCRLGRFCQQLWLVRKNHLVSVFFRTILDSFKCCSSFWFGKTLITLPEANIAREHAPSQKETSIPTIHFQGLCLFEGRYPVSHLSKHHHLLVLKIEIKTSQKRPTMHLKLLEEML